MWSNWFEYSCLCVIVGDFNYADLDVFTPDLNIFICFINKELILYFIKITE